MVVNVTEVLSTFWELSSEIGRKSVGKLLCRRHAYYKRIIIDLYNLRTLQKKRKRAQKCLFSVYLWHRKTSNIFRPGDPLSVFNLHTIR